MTRGAVSRIRGFYERPLQDRLALLHEHRPLRTETLSHLESHGTLDIATADAMIENVIGVHGLPLAVALNMTVNDRDYIVPMAVEEPSIVAAASNASRIARASGGFRADAEPSIMTAQIQFDLVPDPREASQRIVAARERILAAADAVVPNLVRRGGGGRDIEVRVLDANEGVMVVDLYVDVGDAMGANIVDTIAESVAPTIHLLAGGELGLRILSNLPLRRLARARISIDAEQLGGDRVADGIVRASRFAELDPMRAVTHNKGVMNGIDAAALAVGQDWRSIEAGAHAYAAMSGRYRPIALWRRTSSGIEGRIELPLAVGTVGGSTHTPGVRAAFDILGARSSRELASVLASVGLATNLAALRSLATDGIQKGHMRLHSRRRSAPAGAERSEEGTRADCKPTDAREERGSAVGS